MSQQLRTVLFRGLALRMAVACLVYFMGLSGELAPDTAGYYYLGAQLGNYWAGETLIPPDLGRRDPHAYYYIVGTIQFLFDEAMLLPALVNTIVGTLGIWTAHNLALAVADSEAVALRVARYVAYFPSLVLWSALNIRDAWVVLLLLLTFQRALVVQDRLSLSSLLAVGVAIWALSHFRPYLLFAVTLPLLVTVIARRRAANLVRNTILGMLVALVAIYIDAEAGRGQTLPELERLSAARQWSARVSGSGFAADADISTPAKALAFLPVGLYYFILAPFPWTVTNMRQAITVPEMLFYYTLIPAMPVGILYLLRNRLSQSLMLVLLCAGISVGYAVGQGNVGTIYRHRAQVLPFFFIFAAVGREYRKSKHGQADARRPSASVAASAPVGLDWPATGRRGVR
jgi:hypothetical protein